MSFICVTEISSCSIISTKDILASYGQPDERIKKEKIPSNGNLNMDTPNVEPNNTETTLIETDHQSADTGQCLKQTISKGELIIEELKSGPPDAKVAALGKKVKIYYTGHVFDSNVDKDAMCMRIGGKRRLIVPPSISFGDNALGEDVPPHG
ncbi:peptidyl-prolyl cis-trans isomerase [Striga asiatica]|uniref:peptidylprolyl isomerase n=1 Tax=Striga asiatica TaxID=4170 RepID=A0A5A7NXM1_STRAF|nr:peptidyl-prolyl cis-trans isomerase [Striga asiatica]